MRSEAESRHENLLWKAIDLRRWLREEEDVHVTLSTAQEIVLAAEEHVPVIDVVPQNEGVST